MLRTVTSTVFRTDRLRVDLSVSLVSEKGEITYCDYYRGDKAERLNITPVTSVKIKWIRQKDQISVYQSEDNAYLKEQAFITPRDWFSVREDLRIFYHKFQQANVFQYDANGYPATVNESLSIVTNLPRGHCLQWSPAIIPDKYHKERLYPGVRLCVNYQSQESLLYVDEFEQLYDTFMQLNLYRDGMNLLTNFLLIQNNMKYYKELSEENKPIVKRSSKIGIFEQAELRRQQMQQEEVVSKKPLFQEPKTLDDL